MDGSLRDRVVVVTGASRGLGRGIALGLGEAGATVYVSGRSTSKDRGSLPGTIEETASMVTKLGGKGIPVRCDHRIDSDVHNLFEQVRREQGMLDLLVNNAFASPKQSLLWSGLPFWELPLSLWDDLNAVGLRSHVVASQFAVPLMLKEHRGLIINVSSHAAGRTKRPGSNTTLPYSVVKAALHRLTADMAADLHGAGIAVISIWPPATTTEGVLAEPEVWGDISDWNSPLFTGRVVAALAASPDLYDRTGEALVVEELATQLGIVDQAT